MGKLSGTVQSSSEEHILCDRHNTNDLQTPTAHFRLKNVFEMQCFQGKFTHQTVTVLMKLCEP